jgi:hypothetical protein
MEFGSPDRRRSPRVEMTNDVLVGLPISMAVQMLDLSSEGLLMACPQPLRLGARLRVTAQISGRRLDANLDVRHVSNQWDQQVKGYRVGGRFVALDPKVRGAIDDLLGEGGS